VELEQSLDRVKAQGLGLGAISYDSVGVLKAFAEREHITYPLLSDPDSKVIRSYGILNETVDQSTPFFGIPYPGIYVVDARGVVTAKYFEDDYRVRDTAASILLRQFGLEPISRAPVQAKHLTLATAGGEEPARPQQRITLSVDISLPDRVHVYAPGVTGYIPISLSLKPSPAFQADPVWYPQSRSMRLEVIHETVPVYEGHFRMLATITLGGPQALQPLLDAEHNLPIEGEFRYQACDDHECFVPETVPLKWAIRVLPFDRTRAPESLRRK